MINYVLNIEDPNHYGAYLIDSSGTKITTLNNRTGGFKIVIPVSNYGEGMDLTSVKVTLFQVNLLLISLIIIILLILLIKVLIGAGTMNRYSFIS